MQPANPTLARSNDLDVRRAYETGPETPASMGKPLMTAILLASGTLCLSGVAATLLPLLSNSESPWVEPQPVAAIVRAPLTPTGPELQLPGSAVGPLLPRALERLAVTAADAVARVERRFDAQRVAEHAAAAEAFAFAAPAPNVSLSHTATPIAAPAADTTRVVYLIDASGSLVDSLPQVIDWLGESLDRLSPDHAFTVLFFREGKVFEAPPRGMKPGSFAAKSSVYNWVQPDRGNVVPQGRSDLLGAVEAAMSYRPDELYVVSDDSFNRSAGTPRLDDAAILDGIAARLGKVPPKINTVQFFYRDEAGALEAIADRFDGAYTFVQPIEPNATASVDPLLDLAIVN